MSPHSAPLPGLDADKAHRARGGIERSLSGPHAAAALLVLGALVATPWLLPSPGELGSHLLSDRQAPRARPYLEAALKEQASSPEAIVPLARVYEEQGDPEAVLRLLRHLRPRDWTQQTEAMRRVARLEAGETRACVRELERLRRRRPTPAVLRELARLYGERELLELELDVREQLLSSMPDDVQSLREVVWLAARAGERGRALALLRRLWRTRPGVFGAEDFLQLAELSVELDPNETSLRIVERHGPDLLDPPARARLAGRLHALGRPALARRLLAPLVARGPPEAEVVRVWVHTLSTRDELRRAWETLRRWAPRGGLDTGAVEMLCTRALDLGQDAAALDMAERAGLSGLGGGLLLRLGQAAAGGKRGLLRQILAQVPDATLRAHPVIATDLHRLARERLEARRWATIATQTPGLSGRQRLWLAELLTQMGRARDVSAVLRGAVETTPAVLGEPLRLALLWSRSGEPKAGLRAFSAGRARREAPFAAGRALLLAVTGQPQAALVLLQGRPGLIASLLGGGGGGAARRPETRRRRVHACLQGLLDAARRHGHGALTLLALRALLALRPADRATRLALARAELAEGEAEAAVATMRTLPAPLRGEERRAWRQILLAAWRAGAPVKEELIEATAAWARTLDPGGEELQAQVHLLLTLDATRTALPFVEQLARSRGGAWRDRAISLHATLGEAREVWSLLRATGLDEDEPKARRLHAANELLRGGDRQTALRIYRAVAEDEGPEGPTVAALLHLWGPRAGSEAEAWLSERARVTRGAKRVAWIRHLLAVGGQRAAIALIGPDPPEGPLLELLIGLRIERREDGALADLVRRRAGAWRDPDTLRRVATRCGAAGRPEASAIAWRRLLELRPDDPEALLALARAAPAGRALGLWRAWFSLPRDRRGRASWRDRVAYGELLLGQAKGGAQGRAQLRMALDALGRSGEPASLRRREGGRLWARLGRPDKAVPMLSRALETRPCDDDLRADLVAALMATHDFERARALVDPPDRCGATRRGARREGP